MTPSHRDDSSISADRLDRIRADLNKQSPKERKAAEKRARAQVDKAARSPEEKTSLLEMIFGRK